LRLAQDRPAEALSVVQDALDRFGGLSTSRYAWPLLVAGARACAAAASAREQEVIAQGAALRGRLRTEAGKLEVDGLAQQAEQLTFAAEMMRADRGLAAAPAAPAAPAVPVAPAAAAEADGGPGDVPQPGELRLAWDAAAQAWEAAGQPYPLAVALFRASEAALSSGDHDGGAARLRRAAALAEGLEAAPLSDDIELLARRARIGLGDDADARASAAGPEGRGGIPERDQFGLTAREFEVLRLVAAGRSNREIAGELFISAKTASVHVSNILAKLGVASRGEAAATAHRLRIFDSFPEHRQAPVPGGR